VAGSDPQGRPPASTSRAGSDYVYDDREDFRFAVRGDAGLRERFAQLERDGGDVAYREGARELRLERVSVHAHPAGVGSERALADHPRRAVPRRALIGRTDVDEDGTFDAYTYTGG
jgi:hypothetical protein